MTLRPSTALLVAMAVGCGSHPSSPSANAPAVASEPAPSVSAAPAAVAPVTDAGPLDRGQVPARLTSRPLALPGASGTAFLDYIVCERAQSRVWIPVGSTGSVDVLDIASGSFTRIDGFKTAEREMRGKKRTLGPSAATVGDGFVYVGNRATSEVCPIDVKTLKASKCLKLSAATDGVVYVPSAKEVWVTTPQERTLTVLDASKPDTLKLKTTVKTDGAPEGYAVDDARGLFFTNLEDKGGTLAIDVKTRKVVATWNAGCASDGPRGLAFDPGHDFLVVACTDHVQVLDAAHDGARLGKLDTGEGLDNIDYVDGKLYAAAGKAARLTVARLDGAGQLTGIATGDTSEGARNAVADDKGNVFVADSAGARVLVFAGL